MSQVPVKATHGQDEENLPARQAGQPALASAPNDAPPPAGVSTTGRRVYQLMEALANGKHRRELVIVAMHSWGISRRRAQTYVHEAQKLLACEAVHEDPLAYLRKATLQRDKLLDLVFQCALARQDMKPTEIRELVNASCKLLDSRDKVAGRIHHITGLGQMPTPAMDMEARIFKTTRESAENRESQLFEEAETRLAKGDKKDSA